MFELLGRVLLVLRTMQCLDSMPSRDQWVTTDGHLDLEWFDGAFAYEIAERIAIGCHNWEVSELRDVSVATQWGHDRLTDPDKDHRPLPVVPGCAVEPPVTAASWFDEAQRNAFKRAFPR